MSMALIHSEEPERLRTDEGFLLGLQFARLYNSLASSRRAHHRVRADENPSNVHDAFDRILNHAAVVAEALKIIKENIRKLEVLPCWNQDNEHVSVVMMQLETPNSFANTTCRMIRNKIAYHYDLKVIKDILKARPIEDGAVFIHAESDDGNDLFFPLIDQMTLQFMMAESHHTGEPSAYSKNLFDEVASLQTHLAYVLKDLVTDLLSRHLKWAI
jgi:hypothetical protein